MSKPAKTTKTSVKPADFISGLKNETRKKDALTLLKLLKKITNEKPFMYGSSIIGFGTHKYKYESGHSGEAIKIGFSPRSTATVIYVMGEAPGTDTLFKKLGKFKLGKSCLYISNLEDIDLSVLSKIMEKSFKYMQKKPA